MGISLYNKNEKIDRLHNELLYKSTIIKPVKNNIIRSDTKPIVKHKVIKKKILKRHRPVLKLQGIFKNHKQNYAVINNKTLSINNYINGYKIVMIRKDRVKLYNKRTKDIVVLKIKELF